MKCVFEKYYLPFKNDDESDKDLIYRIDKKNIENRFNYLSDRDILHEDT